MDSADKATNKAMSATYKYAAFQTFCIPTKGDNDADATTHDVAPKAAKKAQPNDPVPMPDDEYNFYREAVGGASSLDELKHVYMEGVAKAREYGDKPAQEGLMKIKRHPKNWIGNGRYEMIKVSFDIETIPTQCPVIRAEYQNQIDDAPLELSSPAKYSKAKQDEWLEKKKAELSVPIDQFENYRKLSMSGVFSQIISIGLFANGEAKDLTGKDEKTVLESAFKYIGELGKHKHEPLILIGHAIIRFDLQIIKQRCMIFPHFIPLASKPWENNPYRHSFLGFFYRIQAEIYHVNCIPFSLKNQWPV